MVSAAAAEAVLRDLPYSALPPLRKGLAVREGHEARTLSLSHCPSGYLGMLVCRQQPPAVPGEDGQECGCVPLVPGAITRLLGTGVASGGALAGAVLVAA